ITLKTISEKSGYSISTVSRVLNGIGSISEETKNEILSTAKKLNYEFSRNKFASYKSSTLSIAFLTDFMPTEYHAAIFHGLSTAAVEMNANVSLFNVQPEKSALVKIFKQLKLLQYDGVCLFFPDMDLNTYHDFAAENSFNIPIISNAMIQDPAFHTVTFDGYTGGFQAAEYFLAKGHTTFGVIKGPFNKTDSRFRVNGFKDCIEYNGKSIAWETKGNYEFSSGINAFEEYNSLAVKPTAVFAVNDSMGKGFVQAAIKNGLNIPEDVALIAYDDLPMASENCPRISSIHTDFLELGRVTLQTMQDLISNGNKTRSALNFLSTSLSIKETA
ncbi:MAG: LacI family transcriptional regulator, partial [Balneolales bacterium]|nr:LacI family transcriptional regulator [Balneolales bacterium]